MAALRSDCSFWMRVLIAFSSSSFLWLISSIFVLQTNKQTKCFSPAAMLAVMALALAVIGAALTCCHCTGPPSLPEDAENCDRTQTHTVILPPPVPTHGTAAKSSNKGIFTLLNHKLTTGHLEKPNGASDLNTPPTVVLDVYKLPPVPSLLRPPRERN